MTKTKGQHT